MTQKLLVALAIQGSRNALEKLVRQYYTPIYNYILYRVHDRETAEDLTQDVFVKLTQSIAGYRPAASFSAWLYRIARNTVIDFYRTVRASEALSQAVPIPDFTTEVDERLLVQYLLSQLPNEQKEAVILYYLHGLTYSELSQVLSIPVPTAKSRVRRGLEYLRRRMEEHQ